MTEPHASQRLSLAPDRLTSAEIIQLSIATGLGVGMAEAAKLAFSRHILHNLTYQGIHYVWLAPLVDAVLLLSAGIAVALLARCLPFVVGPRAVVWLVLFVGALGLRGVMPRIHTLAWMILACGLATFFSRVVYERFATRRRWLRPLLFVLLLVWTATAVATGLGMWSSERRAFARLAAPPAAAPNVLWLVMDTVAAQRLSLYGYHQPTSPRLEQFARTGVVFERCMSSSSWTLPGHATMFTGTHPHEQSCGWDRPLDATHPTIAEVLRDQGYATAGFAANKRYLAREFGLARGFVHYRDPKTLFGQAIASSQLARSLAKRTILPMFMGHVVGRKTAVDINRECMAWLSRRPPNRPFFVFANYMEAHTPYVPSAGSAARFGLKHPPKNFPGAQILKRPGGQEWLERATKAYEACVADLDQQIGHLLDELSRRGLLENTLVIITSDHGEQLGERGLLYHSNSLYTPQVRVPLLISYPDHLPANRRFKHVVSLADLPATVMDLLDLAGASPFPGGSLRQGPWDTDTHTGSDADPPTARIVTAALGSKANRLEDCDAGTPIAKGSLRAAMSDDLQYILNGDGSEELYRYNEDWALERNLIDVPEYRDELLQLREAASGIPLERLDTMAESSRGSIGLLLGLGNSWQHAHGQEP